MRLKSSYKLHFVMLGLLVAVSISGLLMMESHSILTANIPSLIETSWPGDIERPITNHATVLLFYHPKCPCTRATVRNLERLAASFDDSPDIVAYAFCPTSVPNTWIESTTTEKLRQLPNTRVVIDEGGMIAKRFGVSTSGHILAYDNNFQLTFSGGVTSSRGHEGTCVAADRLLQCMNSPTVASSCWPVFGCTIVEPSQELPK